MNRYHTSVALIALIFLSSCAKKTAYEIIDRSEDANGMVVSYRVGVPDSYTRENLQSWCDEITGDESNKVVNIEFVYANRLTQQQGLCTSGKLFTIGELNRQFGETPETVPPPGMVPVPPSSQ